MQSEEYLGGDDLLGGEPETDLEVVLRRQCGGKLGHV